MKEYAFPVSDMQSAKPENIDELKSMSRGMTLRDYFAAKAMEGILANSEWGGVFTDVSQDAYRMADAMLEARKNG
jgi:hypothetical protein